MLVYILEILLQSFICSILYIFFFNIFSSIDRKIRPQGINSPDLLKEIRMVALIILLTAIVLLSLTIIINIFYKSLPGFYLVSLFLIYLGKDAIFPSKGRKITENCWVAPHEGRHFIATLNDHAILISGNWIKGKHEHMIYKERLPKWFPPHENELVSEKDYNCVLDAVLKYLERHRTHGVIS